MPKPRDGRSMDDSILLYAEYRTGLVGHLKLQLLDVCPKHITGLTCEGEIGSQDRSIVVDVRRLVPRAGIEDGRVDQGGGCDT